MQECLLAQDGKPKLNLTYEADWRTSRPFCAAEETPDAGTRDGSLDRLFSLDHIIWHGSRTMKPLRSLENVQNRFHRVVQSRRPDHEEDEQTTSLCERNVTKLRLVITRVVAVDKPT